MKVVWSEKSRLNTLEAVEHIARDRPAAAAAWLERLIDRVTSLGQFPRSGRPLLVLHKLDHREIIVAPYRVLYRVEATRVCVLAVRHGRQALTEADIGDEPQ